MRTWSHRIRAAFATGVILGATLIFAVAAAQASSAQLGNPNLPPPQRGLLPSMSIAKPAGWGNAFPPCRWAGR